MGCLLCKIQELFQSASMEEISTALARIVRQGDRVMATVQEVKDAVAAEAAEVSARIDTLAAEIQALKDQLAGGNPITEADLGEILAAVQNIFIMPETPLDPTV